jgi:hypothetical protein
VQLSRSHPDLFVQDENTKITYKACLASEDEDEELRLKLEDTFTTEVYFTVDNDSQKFSIAKEFKLQQGCRELTFDLKPLQAMDSVLLKLPTVAILGSESGNWRDSSEKEVIEGTSSHKEISVLSQYVYKISYKPNQEVWSIFIKLSLLSVGLPLVLYFVYKYTNQRSR